MKHLLSVLAIPALSGLPSLAGENAAPSSHLVYNDANFDGDILINEVRVPKDGEARFTYYEALGWGGKAGGYAGIQAHPKAHNYIFSIWDHKEHSAPIKAVYRGPGTEIENFGGEGTGLKSWNFELGWDTDTWYTLVARCWPVEDHTYYGYWARSQKTEEWTHMVTMDVAVKEAYFQGGNDSFIEDWLETGEKIRTTHLRNGWKRKPNGEWHAFAKARYSVNAWDLVEGKRSYNYRTNWNGGVAKDDTGEYYFMTSGGSQTKPTTTNPSTHTIERNEKNPDYSPIKIQSVKSHFTDDGKVTLAWEIDPKTAPQFSYTVIASDQGGKEVIKIQVHEAHTRTVTLSVPEDAKKLTFEIRCRDIFDNDSEGILAK